MSSTVKKACNDPQDPSFLRAVSSQAPTMQTKAKTNLFRFVTARAPQLIDEDRFELGFIEHPDPEGSHFSDGMVGYSDLEAARLAVRNAADTFPEGSKFGSINEVKELDPVLWDFSNRLLKNRNQIDDEVLDPPSSSDLSTATITTNLKKLWEHVLYDILARENRPVRQACLQMIVAGNYLVKMRSDLWSEENVKRFVQLPRKEKPLELEFQQARFKKRLADAKVVIPPAFTATRQTALAKKASRPLESSGATRNYRKALTAHKAEMAKLRCAELAVLKKEFCAYGANYSKNREAELRDAEAAYDAQVTTIVDDYLDAHPDLKELINNNGGWKEDFNADALFPEAIFPPFEFDYPLPFTEEYREYDSLSEAARTFLGACKYETASVALVLEDLERERRQCAKDVQRKGRKSASSALINGVPVKVDPKNRFDYTFGLGEGKAKGQQLFMTLNVDDEGVHLKGADYSLSVEEGPSAVNGVSGPFGPSVGSTEMVLISRSGGILLLHLFPNETLSIPAGAVVRLEGAMELSNGTRLHFSRAGILSGYWLSGTAVREHTSSEDGPVHYGINSIGVVDYRRVEQELCCYIPGEVSHIENVMAKEYKEKSTRNLVSTANTTELTTETEVESLTDTVSTDRNEMNTEIAKVIQNDRSNNFGARAMMQGQAPTKWQVDVYGDFAISRSTSESNSIARTQAQEYTDRALERIVQKNTIKRTSTIIKEYEENNKHGFDNRKGGHHVTGVYRWVDKVYTNRLVNYGKRLTFEFMVPEPARFYKDAVIVEAEEAASGEGNGGPGSAGVVLPPVHPSESAHQITAASDITRENYLDLCAQYGVTPIAPSNHEVTVSVPHSESPGNTNNPQSFSYHDLSLPPEYECATIAGSGSGVYKRITGNKASITIQAAGQSYHKGGLSGSNKTHHINFSYATNPVTGNIPISVNTTKFKSFSVTITAKGVWAASAYAAWQQSVYEAVIGAYNAQMDAYNAAAAGSQAASDTAIAAAQGEAETGRNPLYNAQVVHTELKRLCIEMLISPFSPPLEQGHDFYVDGECGVPRLPNAEYMRDYAAQVKFFEMAFDWELLSQQFFPYYWAKRCDWKKLFQSTDSFDDGFQAFLQSGMARVMVPIREGHEATVAFFMETGEIWEGTPLVVDTDDKLYLSVVDEMNDVEGFVEDEWQTTVPTMLTIIQDKSVGFVAGGLPCCEFDPAQEVNEIIVESTNTLTLLDETPAPPPEEENEE